MELTDPFGLTDVVLEGQYRIDSVVGEGGFGVVYRGWHQWFEQPIAVKVLKVPVVEDARVRDGVLSKFKEEAKLLFTLSQVSLNVVRSIDFGAAVTPSGVWAPYMILEWLEGRSLAEDLNARREKGLRGRSVTEALALLETAADGLSAAHERKIAHRDIKPANLFLCAGEPARTKVLDFGIAKLMRDEDVLTPGTRSAFSSFTWLYAAPEQLDPRHGATAPWTDVYAFALVLTELLTDRAPVHDADVVSILRAATDPTNRPTPRARGANVPDHIENACRRALDVDPRARFANIMELWDALSGGTRRRQSTLQVRSVPAPRMVTAPSGHVAAAPPAGATGTTTGPLPKAAALGNAPTEMASHRGAPITVATPQQPALRAPSPPIHTPPPRPHPTPAHASGPPMTGHPGTPPHMGPRPLPQNSGCTTALVVGGVIAFIAALAFSACAAGLAQAC